MPSEEPNIRHSCLFRRRDIRRCAPRRGNTHQCRPRRDSLASLRRYRRTTLPRSCYFKRMIEVFGIVKDALAGIAGDDLVIAPDFLKHLGADPNLANFADFITRCRNGDSTTSLADTLIPGKQFGRDRGFDL